MFSKFTWIVLKKEIKDILRDKRTVITGLILPAVLYPILFSIMGNNISSIQAEAESNTSICMPAVAFENSIDDYLSETVFKDVKGISFVNADKEDPVKEQKPLPAKLVYDSTRTDSTFSYNMVFSIINEYNSRIALERLAEIGIKLSDYNAVNLQVFELGHFIPRQGEDTGSGGTILSMLLPLMLVIFSSIGGMAVAVDLFAGEKERRTFEPLLTTRAGRSTILLGKYMAVILFGFATTVFMILGLTLGYALNPEMLTIGSGEITINLPVSILILSALLVFVTVMIFSGIHIIISTYSRTIKEASTYSSFVMIAGMIPAYSTMYMQAGDIKSWMFFVPVLNVISSLKTVLAGVIDPGKIFISLISSLAFLSVILFVTFKMFNREEIMLRT